MTTCVFLQMLCSCFFAFLKGFLKYLYVSLIFLMLCAFGCLDVFALVFSICDRIFLPSDLLACFCKIPWCMFMLLHLLAFFRRISWCMFMLCHMLAFSGEFIALFVCFFEFKTIIADYRMLHIIIFAYSCVYFHFRKVFFDFLTDENKFIIRLKMKHNK